MTGRNRFDWALAMVLVASACGGGGGGTRTGADSGPVGPQPGETGSMCARNADCDSQLCLESGRCTRECSEAAPCPTGWLCDALAGAGLVCQCSIASPDEQCNGTDDDCNGLIDDGATCTGGLVCEGGTCTCPPSERCDGACTDVRSDARHCGACGNACAPGQACENGACVVNCTDPQTRCGDSCVVL
ncbi:MAG: hypothetical protein IT379_00785, partial [Deltaproteobacteria bacterium]|nr:hypothetical protein [Deltaproteobacteria bacterium]